MTNDDPTLIVARDLRAIRDLAGMLDDQAAAKADHHEMPGGDALVMLSPVSSPRDRERRGELIEADWLRAEGWQWCEEHGTVREQCEHRLNPWADEDANWEPPLQTLLFWTEVHRMEDA
jgi:hypothetical protein